MTQLRRVQLFGITILLLSCVSASHGIAAAQKVRDASLRERLNQIADSYTADNAFMGSVLVARGNEILLDKGYGKAVLEQNIPNDPDTKFRIGSLTKQFTAALVLLLQQDGKLRIADPVRNYLPDVPRGWDKITLVELLEHNSGIPEIQSDPGFRSWAMSPHTHAEVIALFKDKPLNFEPGTKHEYSNSNYLVLGAVIEKVTGQDYGTLLRSRILKPLAMNDSGVDKDNLILPKRAQGYMNNNGRLVPMPSESMSVPWSAGSMYSTVNDLLRWERGLFGGKVLSPSSFATMTASGHGLGVAVSTEDGIKVVDHNGAIEGFVAHLAYVPQPRIVVIVLSNVFGGAPPAMGHQLEEGALGKTVVLARERKAVPIANQDLAKFTGIYQMSSGTAFHFAIKGNSLELNAGGERMPLLYQGIKAGRPNFYVAMTNGEIEFIPDRSGVMTTVLWHQYENEQTGKRR